MALFASLLSSTNWRRRSPFSASAAANLSVSMWLLFSAADFSRTASVCCARRRSTSAANSKVRAPDATWSAKAAAYHKKTHEIRNHIKTMNYRSPTRLTCFSCCDACLSCWDTEPATSLVASADEISPLAQKLDHGSYEAPFTPPAAVGEVAATVVGTTASCPASNPAP
jgi:hypothetical protein